MITKLQVITVLSLLTATTLGAQDNTAVWRCGNEYTNQPKAGQACSRVQIPADVVSTGPRKFHAVPQSPSNQPAMPVVIEGPRVDSATQRGRDQQAQQILKDELSKQQRRCQKLPAHSTEMVRCQADEAALRRELARLP